MWKKKKWINKYVNLNGTISFVGPQTSRTPKTKFATRNSSQIFCARAVPSQFRFGLKIGLLFELEMIENNNRTIEMLTESWSIDKILIAPLCYRCTKNRSIGRRCDSSNKWSIIHYTPASSARPPRTTNAIPSGFRFFPHSSIEIFIQFLLRLEECSMLNKSEICYRKIRQ